MTSCNSHRMIGSLGASGWKEPQEVRTTTFCPEQSQLWDETRLLRPYPFWSWEPPRTDCTNTGQPAPLPDAPPGEKAFISVGSEPWLVSVYACCLLFSDHVPSEEPGSVFLITSTLVWVHYSPIREQGWHWCVQKITFFLLKWQQSVRIFSIVYTFASDTPTS